MAAGNEFRPLKRPRRRARRHPARLTVPLRVFTLSPATARADNPIAQTGIDGPASAACTEPGKRLANLDNGLLCSASRSGRARS